MAKVSLNECKIQQGVRMVELENESLIISILPDKGADIIRILYKPLDNMNVMFEAPWGTRPFNMVQQTGTSEELWMDSYPGGWQVMFPNAGGECTYKGSTQGFHGEASIVPWDFQMDSNEEGVWAVFSANLRRTPFRIQKTIHLDREQPIIRVTEKITNLSDEEMDYEYGQHIAFGQPFLNEHCRLYVNNDLIVSEPVLGNSSRLVAGAITDWPQVMTKSGAVIDFRDVPSPDNRSADMAYLTGMKEGGYVLHNSELHFNVRVTWDLEIFPYVWLWQEFNGSSGYPFYSGWYVMGVEPCSTPLSGGLIDSIEQGYARKLMPHESIETEIRVSLYEGDWKK